MQVFEIDTEKQVMRYIRMVEEENAKLRARIAELEQAEAKEG